MFPSPQPIPDGVNETPTPQLLDPTHLPQHLREALSGGRGEAAAEQLGASARLRVAVSLGAALAAGVAGAFAAVVTGVWPL
jgi:hypothetical protein